MLLYILYVLSYKKKLVLCRHTIIYYKQGSITSWTRQTKWYRGYRWYLVNRNGWNWVQSYVHINTCSYFQKEYNLHITCILQKESSNKSSSWFLKDLRVWNTCKKWRHRRCFVRSMIASPYQTVEIYVFWCQGSYQYFRYWY